MKHRRSHRTLLLTAALGAFLAASVPVRAQEWTRFRGPNGSGISQAKGIPTDISDANLAWKLDLPGIGHSSPVLWGEQVFVTCSGDKAGGFSVVCVNAKDGKILWKHDFPLSPFTRHQFNSFASSTPTVDSQRVYIVWNEPAHYFLTALDHQGKQIWQRDFGPFVSQHACGTSPILCDDKVVLADFQDDPEFVEGPMPDKRTGKSSIIAVDSKTGQTLWQTPRKSTVVAYSTPCLFEPKGGPRALIFNSQSHGISALDPDSGKVLWEYDRAFNRRSISSPVIAGDLILGSCGSGGGGNVVTAIKPGDAATGRKPELAYQIKKSAPYVPTSIFMDDRVWLWSDAGIVSCLKAATGEVIYQERVGGDYFGSPVWVDGRLFSVSKTGDLVAVKAGDKFKFLSRYPLKELCHSTIAVALGHLFVHTEKHLWCFGAAKQAAAP